MSSAEPQELPRALLLHDGELADVCDLANRLGARVSERREAAGAREDGARWDVVLGTPRHLLELPRSPLDRASRIAILEKDSRTARAMLQRSGIDFVVRRPVHPAALRLLLLHALYRGPEKRRSRRVAVGTSVWFRDGLRRRQAVLADLSTSGARLLCDHGVARGRALKLRFPTALAGRLSLPGTVVRNAPLDDRRFGRFELAITFGSLPERSLRALSRLVSQHARGPAVLETDAPEDFPVGSEPSERDDTFSAAAAETAGDSAPADAAPYEEEDLDPERRSDPRRALSRRIIALGVEAARVLIGRDISLRGMRVDPDPHVKLGDRLQIALHVRAREEPLVVEAEVSRDDGPGGMYLEFRDLSDSSRRYLERMVNFLPVLAMRDADGGGAGVIVSEILERHGME